MTKRINYQQPNAAVQEAAEKMAKATQRPGQTKEQTRLIAQGIQKGIEQYKKQQNAKTRELDKALKKARHSTLSKSESETHPDSPEITIVYKQSYLAWILLIISWLGIAGYWLILQH